MLSSWQMHISFSSWLKWDINKLPVLFVWLHLFIMSMMDSTNFQGITAVEGGPHSQHSPLCLYSITYYFQPLKRECIHLRLVIVMILSMWPSIYVL